MEINDVKFFQKKLRLVDTTFSYNETMNKIRTIMKLERRHVFLRMQIYLRIKLLRITFDNYLSLMKTALKMKVIVE